MSAAHTILRTILRGGGLHNQVSLFNPRIAYCTIALVSSTGAESAVATSLLISAGGGKGVWLGSLYGGGAIDQCTHWDRHCIQFG